MSNKAPSLSLPQGGGALSGMGEKFSADLFTGTGNFSVPIALPQGRNGMTPQLSLGYSTGSGNGPWGLGWGMSIPGVMRKTDRGIPVYNDEEDVFILSGAEDLVPIKKTALTDSNGALTGYSTQYRPRTEGLFARIEHIKDSVKGNYWQVRSKDGLISYYGTPNVIKDDLCVIADPNNRNHIFGWKLSKTVDPFGNHILYSYTRELSYTQPHVYDQLYLSEIKYCDYDDPASPEYLLQVKLNYTDRTDAFSSYKQGFEMRTTKRCSTLEVYTNAASLLKTKTYHFTYLDEIVPDYELPINRVSMLAKVQIEGHDGVLSEWMPPLEFRYSEFQPKGKDFYPVNGSIPSAGLASPELELVDLTGNGLPDILEMNGSVRWYRNMGNATFSMPVEMSEAPFGLTLGDPNVQMLDANGDGRADLLVNRDGFSGYFSTRFGGGWDKRYFQQYQYAPSFSFSDPTVRMMDLDGDGVTDVLRIGDQNLICYFNDPEKGFYKTTQQPGTQLDGIGALNFQDPRIRLADMTGDGMQDIVMINQNQVSYWPNLGYGRFGKRVIMHDGLNLPAEFDTRRLLLGDIDGDGCADLVYVENGLLRLWMNRSGNTWSDGIIIKGTPQVSDMDAVRLSDITGSGVSGILWTGAMATDRKTSYYLDFTAGNKPYLLQEMDNNMGSLTRVEYKSSLYYYLQDEKRPETRWKSELPFPVLVVSKVEVIDKLSLGKLTTEYAYHHGYWDGFEKEFRGFGQVDQRDTESFDRYNSDGLQGRKPFDRVSPVYYTPPMLTKTWFHQGAMGEPFGGFYEANYSTHYWKGDPQGLSRPQATTTLLQTLPAWDKRDALRTLRGTTLRTEVYALDGSPNQERPYTVTESVSGIKEIIAPDSAALQKNHRIYRIFFPIGHSQRSTQWERGNEPMTSVSLSGRYDEYGQLLESASLGVPKGGNWRNGGGSSEEYLATASGSAFIYKDEADQYMTDRVLYAKNWDASADPVLSAIGYLQSVIDTIVDGTISLPVIGHSISYYDGTAFTGLPYGQIGDYGVQIRSETLIITPGIITAAYGGGVPPCFSGSSSPDWSAYPADFVSAMQDTRLGYTYKNAAPHITGYYISPGSSKFDFQDGTVLNPRGILLQAKDTFGATTTIEYDAYDFLPETVTDALDMETSVQYDYRVLQPDLVTDPNLNRSRAAYSPLGLLYKTAIQGKSSESKGDTMDHPTTLLEYDFFNFLYNGDPVWVKTSARERHYYDDPDSPYIVKQDYSDGFGRLLQTRTQAEDVLFGDTPTGDSGLPANHSTPNEDAIGHIREITAPLNVIVSGWQVYNNKGKVVEKYEPFFDNGFDYKDPGSAPYGETAQVFYDPRGQVVRTINPDGTEQRIVFGRPIADTNPDLYAPTPWQSCTYDANDLSSTNVAYGTPKISYLDCMGRTIKTYEKNKYHDYISNTDEEQEIEMSYTYDIRSNLILVKDRVTDGSNVYNRTVFSHIYDLKPKADEKDPGANRLKTIHIDSGTTHSLVDAATRPVKADDAKGAMTLMAYDELSRPIIMWARDDESADFTERQVTQYGDDSGLTDPEDENLKGKVWRLWDEAGRIETPEYDFKGNPLSNIRRIIKPSEILSIFAGPPVDWDVTPYRVDWDGLDTSLLDSRDYVTDIEYDALNRITLMTYPEAAADNKRRILIPEYNKAGALTKVDLKDDSGSTAVNYVERIAYNARGQRLLLALGNGLMTRYIYNSKNFRLLRLKTEAYDLTTTSTTVTYEPQSGTTKQDYLYTYDSVGNILNINDQTPNGGVAGVTGLSRNFYYDSLYRLLKATGRENGPTTSDPYLDNIRSDVAANTRAYSQMYRYDELGNIQEFNHDTTGGGSFTRFFTYQDIILNNLLEEITIGATDYDFTYDDCGNQIVQTLDRNMRWDYANKMKAFYVQAGTSEPTKYTQYLYDAGGKRLMKVNRVVGGNYSVRVYIGAIFEEYWEIASNVNQGYQNEIIIMDDVKRIASKRIGNSYGDSTPTIQYVFSDHLDSSNVLCDDIGSSISREEYYPFGETSFGSYAQKRYRFSGKEKDDESGMYSFGFRYYLPWTCRFISVDPLCSDYPHLTSFNFAADKPITQRDLYGLQGENEKKEPDNNQSAPGPIFVVKVNDNNAKNINEGLALEIQSKNLPKYFKDKKVKNIDQLASLFKETPKADEGDPESTQPEGVRHNTSKGVQVIRSRSTSSPTTAEKGMNAAEFILWAKDVVSDFIVTDEEKAKGTVFNQTMALGKAMNLVQQAQKIDKFIPSDFKSSMQFYADLVQYIYDKQTLPTPYGTKDTRGQAYRELVQLVGNEIINHESEILKGTYELKAAGKWVPNQNFQKMDNAGALKVPMGSWKPDVNSYLYKLDIAQAKYRSSPISPVPQSIIK